MKRDATLVPLSRDHHHALVLARALRDPATAKRAGLPVEPEALIAHVRRRFVVDLEPHFRAEERALVPQCRGSGVLEAHALRVERDHESLRDIVASLAAGPALSGHLDAFARQLEDHVHFEEREWFPALEAALGPAALAALAPRLRPIPTAAITGYHQDEHADWVAELDCGHTQHVRHKPPFQLREWVTTEEGRGQYLGTRLDCIECRDASADG